MGRKRYLAAQVEKDLARKMVFVGGARQVGKTTLALQVLDGRPGYLNWDVPEDRERILTGTLPRSSMLVFDEIHKYRPWRNYLKGLYDAQVSRRRKRRILVTGSARLDFYRFGGDSLQGRYHYLRLHPFSVAELGVRTRKDFAQLLELGGFPEPFLGGSAVEARRWSRECRTRLIRDDLVSLERVQDLGSILYAVFRLAPFGAPGLRAVKKERKHYHADWSLVRDPALRFENLVASHLLKWVHFEEDSKGRDLELRYFRDVTGREVDFVVTEARVPRLMVECKWSDGPIDKSLRYLKQRFPDCDAYQLSATGKKDFETPEGILACHALELLRELI
jgi:predicted AAA+ superfamily ATPase